MRSKRKPASGPCPDQMALPLRGESGRFLSLQGLSGPGSAGADRWASECLTAKAENPPETGAEPPADSGAVNVLHLLVLAGFALAVGMTYMQHPRMVQLGVGLVVTLVTVAIAWVVASRVNDNRPVRNRPERRRVKAGGFVPVRPPLRVGSWQTPSPERISRATHEEIDAVAWPSLPSSVPAAVVLWETLKGTRRRRKLRHALAGRTSATTSRGSGGRQGRTGGRR